MLPLFLLIEETIQIKLHPENINREERFKVSKEWHMSTRLLRHFHTHVTKSPRTQRALYTKETK
jgi:hypothetical protein